MYISLEEELPCFINRDEGSLLQEIINAGNAKEKGQKRREVFQQKYVTEYGNGSKKSCDIIADILMEDNGGHK